MIHFQRPKCATEAHNGAGRSGARGASIALTITGRLAALVFVLGFVSVLPGQVSAQDHLIVRRLPALAAASSPVAAVPVAASTTPNLDLGNDPTVAARRLADVVSKRLRPIESRLRGDPRVCTAGTLFGLAAIAAGSMHGSQSLTLVGTGVVHAGLHRQLAAVHARTGFSVSPVLGGRSISVVVSRTFP